MHSETVLVPMRDGVDLSTEVLTPQAEGPWPAIIVRTPYSKSGIVKFLGRLCDHGYAVIAQDVRGTGESGGTFDILRQEPDDAADTAAWVLSQPFCDRSIGTIGLSYLAPASVSIAARFKENVKACVWLSPVINDKSLFLQSGALRLHHNLPWMALRNPRFLDTDWKSVYSFMPLKDALASAGISEPDWPLMCRDWDKWWAGRDMSDYFRSVEAPGLHFAGFWDFMLDSAFMGYGLLKNAPNPQVLVLGPWTHNGVAPEVTKNSYADYGPDASPRFMQRTIDWFDHWIKGKPLPIELQHTCYAFVPGRGWVASEGWPPSGSSSKTFYLGESRGQGLQYGSLLSSPETAGEACFDYDPKDPVPTEGGAVWEFPKEGLNPGPAQVTTGKRPDVLVFRSESLDQRVACLGPAIVTLFVSSDAPGTDFTVKIVDEDADGIARVVADTIYRWNREKGREIALGLPAIGHVFDAGHRVRLDISSSNFPKFDRNLNTGTSDLISSEARVARQTIGFGKGAPSRMSLTIIPDSDQEA